MHPWNAGNDKLIICCSRQLENRGYCERETKNNTGRAMMSHRVCVCAVGGGLSLCVFAISINTFYKHENFVFIFIINTVIHTYILCILIYSVYKYTEYILILIYLYTYTYLYTLYISIQSIYLYTLYSCDNLLCVRACGYLKSMAPASRCTQTRSSHTWL